MAFSLACVLRAGAVPALTFSTSPPADEMVKHSECAEMATVAHVWVTQKVRTPISEPPHEIGNSQFYVSEINTPGLAPAPFHIAGISRPLPVSSRLQVQATTKLLCVVVLRLAWVSKARATAQGRDRLPP